MRKRPISDEIMLSASILVVLIAIATGVMWNVLWFTAKCEKFQEFPLNLQYAPARCMK